MIRLVPAAALLGALLFVSGCTSDPELVWHEDEGYRWAELPARRGTGAGFEEMPSERTGVAFVNTLGQDMLLQNRHYMNGSGVAIGDIDGDGWTDLYFARLEGPNVLYRNLGNWRFEDVTERAGVAAADRFSTGAVFADVDGDGDLDLLVTAMGGPNAAYLNDGTGRFTEVTEEAGLSSNMGSTTMALSDVDGDADLDLYVANYKARSVNDMYSPLERGFERTVRREGESFRIAPEFERHYVLRSHAGGILREERAEPNRFYLNDGSGRFSPAEEAFLDDDGTPIDEVPEDWSLTARFQDVNLDGAPDLYVCNDFQSPDYFWLGDGRGTFHPVPPLAVRKTSFSTMSVDFSDVDRDRDLDFFLTDMLSPDYSLRQTQVGLTIPMPTDVGEIENRPQAVQNMLQLNRGDATYAEIARMSGVAASDWTWSGLFLDVDLDGYEDLLLATGHAYDVLNIDAQKQEMMNEAAMGDRDRSRRLLLDFPRLPLHNVAFRNNGDLTFERVPEGWGLGRKADVSHALAFGDLDNDGDLDVVVNRLNETAGVFRNEAAAPRVAVRLRGKAPNTQGIGARIRVTSRGLPQQEKEAISGGQYLSGSDPVYSFAAEGHATIEVIWRSGARSRLEAVPANRVLEIFEPVAAGEAATPDSDSTAAPHFVEANTGLSFRHRETAFDDFARQPLLPRRLSRSGPGVAWVDFDHDGDDDLLAGNGPGFALFRNERGSLVPAGGVNDAPGEVTGLVAGGQADGGTHVLAGISNYETTPPDSSWIHLYEISPAGRARLAARLPFGPSSVGPLTLADLDGDGDLDLFAGGRTVPGRYPEPASSRIYLREDGVYRYESGLSSPFDHVGLVTGAAAGDLDGDGDSDLVLATEWSTLRYFENDGTGRFTDRTATSGLEAFSGWWHGVAMGDFNEDGLLDLVATNWGWNGVYGRFHGGENPLRLYYLDFDVDGTLDVLESHFEPDLDGYVPMASFATLSEAMPYVAQRMQTNATFARSSLREVVGPKLDRAPHLETTTLSHMLFLNEGEGRFSGSSLPIETQVSPAFDVVVADFDSDGHEDLFLSQNFFGLPSDIPRQDAGRGILVLGDGRGGFRAREHSGIGLYGEQRGAAVADLDSDGRPDLVAGQNGAELKLFRNTATAHGLRVRLHGPAGNPAGIGSVVFTRSKGGATGPARLVSAGSGYRSQSSPVVVLGRRAQASEIVVRWPGGRESSVPVDAGDIEISVSFE